MSRWLDGSPPAVNNQLGWPLPPALSALPRQAADSTAATTITITDTTAKPSSGHALLHPPSLVAGVGASSDAPAEEVPTLLAAALAAAGLARDSVAEIATIDRRAGDPALTGLGLPVRAFATEELAAVTVPTPSAAVESAVGTPSVCEAAALLGAGEGAELVVTKQVSPHATVAIARRRHPRGRLSLVGLGPGDRSHRTTAAKLAIAEADVIVGYSGYLDLCSDLITPAQEVVASPIGDEVVRAKRAVAEAAAGRRVALVCSGDSGVYGMASIALEVADEQHLEADIEVVPGVTAALAAAAAAGAPLGHDHAVVSLSDLLTPWPVIAARLEAVAAADFVVALYNPRSNARKWQLEAARSILLEHRAPSVPVAIVTAATRPGESVHITTLGQLDPGLAGMTTCVIVGASTTRMMGRSLVTPRGYHA
jgi:cobalt-precorrin 5A hydrolase/precorrin-3B C17-methyltransferase